nr:proline-rich protein 2-like [Rattus norvegicus]
MERRMKRLLPPPPDDSGTAQGRDTKRLARPPVPPPGAGPPSRSSHCLRRPLTRPRTSRSERPDPRGGSGSGGAPSGLRSVSRAQLGPAGTQPPPLQRPPPPLRSRLLPVRAPARPRAPRTHPLARTERAPHL